MGAELTLGPMQVVTWPSSSGIQYPDTQVDSRGELGGKLRFLSRKCPVLGLITTLRERERKRKAHLGIRSCCSVLVTVEYNCHQQIRSRLGEAYGEGMESIDPPSASPDRLR